MTVRQTIHDIDLSKQLVRIFGGNLLAKNDKKANRMGVNVFQDGKAVSLSGYTVKGYFIRNGVETLILDGVVDGNTAYVDLDARCYHKDGSYSLAVKLCKDSTEQTLVIFDGRIAETITDTVVENENTLSLADIIQQDWVQNVLDAADTAMTSAQQAQAVLDSIKGTAPAIYEDASGAMVQIKDGAAMPVQSLVSQIDALQTGAGDPSISNVRPISGWNSVGAAVTGHNLYSGGDHSFTTSLRYTLPVPLPAGTYVISAIPSFSSDTSKKSCGMALFDTNRNSIQTLYFYKDTNDGTRTHVVTVDKPIGSIRFHASDTHTNSNGHTATWSNIQIVPGDRERIFTPYSGEMLTAQLTKTVYGGSVDLVTGNGSETMGYHELTGDETIIIDSNATYGNGVIIRGVLPVLEIPYLQSGICSHAVVTIGEQQNAMYMKNNGDIVWYGILDTIGKTTVEEFKAWLVAQKEAGKPVQIVYFLGQSAIPFQVEALPIATQKGVNNIWTGMRGIEVTYAADTKLYIDKKLAAIAAAQLNA